MSWTLSTSGAAKYKAGINANTTITTSGAWLDILSDQAEAYLSTVTGYDWVNNYSNITTSLKPILSLFVADHVGANIISADMSGYTSRTEAQTMLDFLTNEKNDCIAALKDSSNKTKLLITP